MAKKRQPDVKHKPRSRMSSSGRGRRSRPRGESGIQEREAQCLQATDNKRAVRGEAETGGRVKPDRLVNAASFTRGRRPERASVSVGSSGKQQRLRNDKRSLKRQQEESWPRRARTEAETFSTVRKEGEKEEIWVQGDFRVWGTKLQVFA